MLTLDSNLPGPRGLQTRQSAGLHQILRASGRLPLSLLRILLFLFSLNSIAADYYIAQTPRGSGDGTSAANAKAIGSFTMSTLAAGDTLHLVGTITNVVNMASSGAAGNNITVYFESGAKLSMPNGLPFDFQSQTYVTVDGGTGGIVENTATGTGLTYSNASSLFAASGAGNITVKNLLIRNQYIHTSTNDISPNIAACGGIYANGLSGDNYFLNCTFSNVGWCLNILASPQSMMASNCFFINYDHGIVPGGTSIVIANCRFNTTACWDTTANSYHHDPIHYFGVASTPTNFVIEGNIFTGDMGNNNTAMIYLESGPANVLMINNLFLQWPSNYLNNGMVVCNGANGRIYNNTFLGATGTYNSGGLQVAGTGTAVVNNLFNLLCNFVYVPAGSVTFSNNLYANIAAGGNPPWAANGAGFNSLATWQAGVGEANSTYANGVVINSDGTVPTFSPAIGVGANLSNIFTTDCSGLVRGIKWNVGAFNYTKNGPSPPFLLKPQ